MKPKPRTPEQRLKAAIRSCQKSIQITQSNEAICAKNGRYFTAMENEVSRRAYAFILGVLKEK